MTIDWIEETGSTNAYVKEHAAEVGPMAMVAAHKQTAGRGQRGNSWESEPGKNLTYSFWLRPGVHPRGQFAVSEAVALAMAEALGRHGIDAEVKWPNDIYVGDRKIAGILIECTLMGEEISMAVAGVGLNVNQTIFKFPATATGGPVPVSMAMLTGREYDLGKVARVVADELERHVALLDSEEGRAELHRRYMARLWRREGRHRYRDRATGEEFTAEIAGVKESGHLQLLTDRGPREYAFKEIEPAI